MTKKSILLIDDDQLVLSTLKRLLEKSGHMVQAFQSAEEAIQAAMMEDFDLIVTDIRMPRLDGFQTIRYIREIRREKGKPETPEILITGYAKDYEDEVSKLKPHAIIHKPFPLEEFIASVNTAFGEE